MLWLGLSLGLQVQAISYTVQVAAFSDETVALQALNVLLDQGYPAYLISVPTMQGQIYRIRVGSFSNREAALLFAEVMQGLLGSTPSPALAETIPGDYSFQARLLGRYDPEQTSVQLITWNDRSALRTQPKDLSTPATYTFGSLEFLAWLAVPEADGWILRIVSQVVNDPEQSPELREQNRSVLLANIAGQLGLTPQQVAAFEFPESDQGPAYLVLVERWNPETQQRILLKAIGQAGSTFSAYGPELVRFQGEELKITPPEDSLELSLDMSATKVQGKNWFASKDGDFIRIVTQDPQKSWRIAIGQPLMTRDDFLIAGYQGDLLVYQLEPLSP